MLSRPGRMLTSVSAARSRHRHVAGALLIGLLAIAVGPALAWNPPPTQENRGLPTYNGKPGNSPVLSYFADAAWVDLYSPKGHGYIIQHAIEMLRADGYGNWADVAHANQMHLLSGAAHADKYLGRVRACFQIEFFWGLFSADLYEYDICPRGGCDHYHNVSDGTGLKMPVEATLAGVARWVARAFLSVGPIGANIDIKPHLKSQYPSAVGLCQQHFDTAQNIWRTGSFTYPSRSAVESSFYELGWACHLLGDQAVTQHQRNSFFGGHADYENFADGKGSSWDYPQYHPSSAIPFNAYHHDRNAPGGPWRAYDYARTVAEKIYYEPGHHALAEDGGPAERDKALRFAMPLAEAYTAGLIARFMSETGIPATSPPISGYVRARNGGPMPGAYVFYADVGSTAQIEQNVPRENPIDRWKSWDMVRTDSQGRYSLAVKPNNYYLLRAASPGYSFEGGTSTNLEFGERKCPVVYYQPAGMYTANTLDLYLEPTFAANVATLIGRVVTAGPPVARAASVQAVAVGPGTEFVIRPGTELPVSRTDVSPALAHSIQRAVLSVDAKDCVLGAAGGGTKLAETTTVDVQLSRLVELATASVVATPAQTVRALDRHRVDRADITRVEAGVAARATRAPRRRRPDRAELATIEAGGPASARRAPESGVAVRMETAGTDATMAKGMAALSAAQVTQLNALLPSRQIADANGQPKTVYRLRGPESIASVENQLHASGLVIVPGLPGVEVEVSVVPGAGFLGGGIAPTRLVTDNAGRARLGIQAGSHAGLLRLRFKITSAPDGILRGAEQTVNLLIQPRVSGPDPSASQPPVLQPLPTKVYMIQGTVIAPRPTATLAPTDGRSRPPVTAQPTGPSPQLKPPPARPRRAPRRRGGIQRR